MANEYADEVIIRALTKLASKLGNVSATLKELKAEEGLTINVTTLKRWRDSTHAVEYQTIRDRMQSQYESQMVHNANEVIAATFKGEMLAIERTIEGLAPGMRVSPKDTSAAGLSLTRIKKENMEKVLTLTGRPSQIIDDRSTQSALNTLIAKGILKRPTPDDGED